MTFFDVVESMALQSYIMYIITIIAIVIYIFLLRGTPVKRPRLVWVDKSRKTKAFRNKAYGVSGKPDCIYKLADGYRLVEFKSRKSGIYESDRVQAKAAALAARGGSKYKITEILIQTKSTEELIPLIMSDEQLYQDIKYYIELAQKAHQGEPLKAIPEKRKCKYCAYVKVCTEKAC